MAKGYWVVHLDVDDPVAYRTYQAFVNPFLAANGGRFLVRGGVQEVPEGQVRSRTVVIEWPSYAAARAAYHSDDYAEGRRLRATISTADFSIVEGIGD